MNRSPSSPKIDSYEQLVDQVRRVSELEALERAYRVYSRNPSRAAGFGALRALVHWCRGASFEMRAARILAELARIDGSAQWPIQLILKSRKETEAMRRHASNGDLQSRKEEFFRAVVWHIAKYGGSLPDAYAAVAGEGTQSLK